MRQKPPAAKQGRRGFALLITIVLLAFLVLIMVSFAALTRVEIQVAKNYQQLDQARHNALTGLNIALGQLQKYAGPDQSVTARAEITSTTTFAQPYLTGVWRSTNTTSTPDSWLVSGNEVAPTAVTPATAPNPATGTFPVSDTNNQVYLVGTGSASSLAQGVLLAKQAITAPSGSMPGLAGTPTTGHYAWWVGDEGVKASACLVDQNLISKPLSYNNSGALPGDDWSSATDLATIRKRNQLNQLMQPRPALEKILTTVPPAPDSTDLTSMPKLLTINQLPLLPSASGATANAILQKKSSFHDLTALCRGVLADTSTGKLRVDLSPANTGNTALDSYIKLRPDIPASATAPYVSVFYPQAFKGTAGTWPGFVVTPVMSEAALLFSFDISGGQIRLKYYLMVELWNPYSATLKIDNATHALTYSVTIPTAVTFKLTQTATPTDLTQTVTLPAGTTFSRTTTFANAAVAASSGSSSSVGSLSIGPGRTVTLIGGDSSGNNRLEWSGSTPSPLMGAVNLGAPTTITAINKADMTTSVTSLDFKLTQTTGGAILQERKSTTFYNVTTTSSALQATVSNANLPCLAYGYSLNGTALQREVGDAKRISSGSSMPAWEPRSPLDSVNGINGVSNATTNAGNNLGNFTWYRQPAFNGINLATSQYLLGSAGVFQENSGVRVADFDLPRQELISVAELRHMVGTYPLELGNTWGSACNAYFDACFFSTVPQNYNWPVDGSEPRPNRYLEVYTPMGTPPATLSDLRGSTTSARYQLIRGAFNINSTSVSAWQAVLSSPTVSTWDFAAAATAGSPSTNTASSTASVANAFYRMPAGAKEVTNIPLHTVSYSPVPTTAQFNTSSDGNGGSVVFGAMGRQLTDAEVTALATAIVVQLKTATKPYSSLAAFMNAGVIEQAITASAINPTRSWVGNASTQYFTPSYITQADIIAKIAPFMAQRSDTFIIRTYGDVQNPVTSKIEARVWCEATVQRVPDLVSDPSATVVTVMNPPAAANPFGRRFRIVGFRWLSDKDI